MASPHIFEVLVHLMWSNGNLVVNDLRIMLITIGCFCWLASPRYEAFLPLGVCFPMGGPELLPVEESMLTISISESLAGNPEGWSVRASGGLETDSCLNDFCR